MKKRTHFLPLIILNVSLCTAQPFKLFEANSRFYFTNSAMQHTQLFGFACDSATISGADSVYYPYRTLGYNPSLGFCNVLPDFPYWTGPQVKNVNGNYSFLNLYNDTIHINTLTALTDTFVLYKYANADKILAMYSSIVLQTFAGITDSVKIFTLQMVNATGAAITGTWNGKHIRVSKNNGMVQIPNMRDFPSDTSLFVRTEGKRLTYNDLYTWQPGDVIHERFSSSSTMGPWYVSSSTLYNLNILSRTQINSDSVVFTIARKMHYTVNFPPTSTFSTDTISFSVGKLTQYVHTQMPDQTIDSVHTYSLYRYTSDCGRLRMADHAMNSITNQGGGCIHYEGFEPYYRDSVYIENLTGYYIDEQPHYINNYSFVGHYMLYSNIGGVVCGNPSFVAVDEMQTENLHFSIWPNPASDVINWLINQTDVNLRVFDLSGKLTLQTTGNQTGEIDISSLSEGCYTVIVETPKNVFNRKLIVSR
jgi:hypothetical protein